MAKIISEHIEITPGTCGGKPHIAGHRIKVQDIAIWYEEMNLSPHDIVKRYPTITLADVHAALAYYYDNKQEGGAFAPSSAKQTEKALLSAQQIREGEQLEAQMRASIPSKVPENE